MQLCSINGGPSSTSGGKQPAGAAGRSGEPANFPARYLLSKLNYSLEPLENARGGEDGRRLSAEYARRHAEDAAAQAEWERGAS